MGTLSHLYPRGKEPPREPLPRLSLTAEETRHLRASLRNLQAAFGSWGALASAMGVREKTITQAVRGQNCGSALLAWRASQASGIPVEQILTGKLVEAGACPLCGRKAVGT